MTQTMRRTTLFALMTALAFVIAAVLLSRGSVPAAAGTDQVVSDAEVFQDEAEALEADIALASEQTAVQLDDMRDAVLFQESFAAFVEQVASDHPGVVAWVDPAPATTGYIRFPGEAPPRVGERAARRDLDVQLIGNAGMSFSEQVARAEVTFEALEAAGLRGHTTFYSPQRNRIQIELGQDSGSGIEPSVTRSIAATLTQQFISRYPPLNLHGRATDFLPTDFDISVNPDGPVQPLSEVRGGVWTRRNGVNHCTVGWSARGHLTTGLITAGHCHPQNGYRVPGFAQHPMTISFQSYGIGGDTAYYRSTQTATNKFYPSASTVRNVTARREDNSMVGFSTCSYGRASNNRQCNHTVEAVGLTRSVGGHNVSGLARASNRGTLTGGDSGGGWSLGEAAWGISTGMSGTKAYFVTIRRAEGQCGCTIFRS